MEELKSKAGSLTQSISNYLDTFYKLALVNLTQKATNLTAGILAGITTLFLFILTVFFLGLGLAWWLCGLINSMAGGFFIVAGIFILLMVAIILLRKKLVFPLLKKAILKKIYE
jgi:apolipoprotein N-acyltransferase